MSSIVLCVLNVCKPQEYPGLLRSYVNRKIDLIKMGFFKPHKAIIVSGWLISKKSSSLKPLGQMNQNLVGSILGRLSIKVAHLVPIR
jgi:hypothetical protein